MHVLNFYLAHRTLLWPHTQSIYGTGISPTEHAARPNVLNPRLPACGSFWRVASAATQRIKGASHESLLPGHRTSISLRFLRVRRSRWRAFGHGKRTGRVSL